MAVFFFFSVLFLVHPHFCFGVKCVMLCNAIQTIFCICIRCGQRAQPKHCDNISGWQLLWYMAIISVKHNELVSITLLLREVEPCGRTTHTHIHNMHAVGVPTHSRWKNVGFVGDLVADEFANLVTAKLYVRHIVWFNDEIFEKSHILSFRLNRNGGRPFSPFNNAYECFDLGWWSFCLTPFLYILQMIFENRHPSWPMNSSKGHTQIHSPKALGPVIIIITRQSTVVDTLKVKTTMECQQQFPS